jgi:hypothetical protein
MAYSNPGRQRSLPGVFSCAAPRVRPQGHPTEQAGLMFTSFKNVMGFLAGLGMTVGLLLTPRLIPGGWGFEMGLRWPLWLTFSAAAAGLALLAGALWLGGRMIRGAQSWKEARVLAAAVMIALVGNTLYMMLVDWFGLHSGWRALVAVVGVPVIYGNLGRVLGKQPLAQAMAGIFTGALATMGAGFVLAALIKGW